MKRVVLLFAVLVLVCGSLMALWTLPSLLPERVRTPSIDMQQLLIDTNDLPLGWKERYSAEPFPKGDEIDWGDENLLIAFGSREDQGFVSHAIFRFRNDLAAQYGLSHIQAQGLVISEREPLIALSQWHYTSPVADDWLMACHPLNDGGSSCTAVARYDEYISAFDAAIDNKQLTIAAFKHLLTVIDEKMKQDLKE